MSLFRGQSLPVVRFPDREEEAFVRHVGICAPLRLVPRVRVVVVDLHRGEMFKVPRFANGKRSVRILAGLVDPDSAGASHGDDYAPGLFGLRIGVGGWRRSWVHGVFYD